ncbi:MAG: hypothetical protein U0228_23595 [Myxococcaceae bacterium]
MSATSQLWPLVSGDHGLEDLPRNFQLLVGGVVLVVGNLVLGGLAFAMRTRRALVTQALVLAMAFGAALLVAAERMGSLLVPALAIAQVVVTVLAVVALRRVVGLLVMLVALALPLVAVAVGTAVRSSEERHATELVAGENARCAGVLAQVGAELVPHAPAGWTVRESPAAAQTLSWTGERDGRTASVLVTCEPVAVFTFDCPAPGCSDELGEPERAALAPLRAALPDASRLDRALASGTGFELDTHSGEPMAQPDGGFLSSRLSLVLDLR